MANEWVKALGMLYDYKPNEKYNQDDMIVEVARWS